MVIMKTLNRYLTKILVFFVLAMVTAVTSMADINSAAINIGMILCDEGACAHPAANMARGAQLALDEINAKDGILGKKATLVIRYSQESDDIKSSRDALESLIKFNNLSIVIGPSTKESALELLSVVDSHPNLILITPTFNSDDYTKFSDRIFSTVHKSSDDNFRPFDENFRQRFKNAYNELPEQNADIAYDTIYLLKEAIEAVGGTQTEVLKREIADKKFYGVSGLIHFNQYGSAIVSGK